MKQRTMDSKQRWHKIQELLDALEKIPTDEHEAYLARACSDEEIREEVLALLAVDEKAEAYLDEFAEGFRPAPAETPDLTGRRIGAYHLLKPLGRGGMGVVYEAKRADDTFEQRVALKLLTTALMGTEAHQRFIAERRILAGLEHPAVARILDGGVTEDGTPWFAMEYVQGMPIDDYCDQHRLGIRERLELFLQVCDAVEHAHRRLVVHRDLKPGNVLVTDGKANRFGSIAPEGAPTGDMPAVGGSSRANIKLLDFGIAKLLESESDETPTRTNLRLMTPEYASPEQVRGQPVTTASDVYQLGLLLYELLTGHRPYVLKHRNSAGELEQVICEQPPTRLSVAITRNETLKCSSHLTTDNEELTTNTICQSRCTSPAKLRRRLRGDLENIVGKALSKEPERRYGSADRLAQDIRRHLAGLPVLARADTWVYRGRKFVQRHAVGAAVAMVVLVLIIAVTGFHITRVQDERNVAQQERDRAEAEAAKAQQVSEFMTGLFRSVRPREARGRELTARELLDHGVVRIEYELSAQPEIRADMLHVLGQTYLEMGMYDSADELLNQALYLCREQLGPDHPDAASILTDLGLLDYRRGSYARAEALLEEAINNLKTFPIDEVTEKLAYALSVKGENYSRLGKLDKALSTLQRALELQSEVSGHESPTAARIMHRIGVLYRTTGQITFAEQHFRNAIEIYEQKFGADYPDIGTILVDLAAVVYEQGNLESAEEAYRRGLAILEKAYGPVHGNVGIALNNLGGVLLKLNRPEEAVETLQRAHEIQVAAVGPDHPEVALSLANLGAVYLDTGRLEEARDAFQQGAEVRSSALGPEQFDGILLYLLVGLGRANTALENRDAADKSLGEALTVWRRAPDTMDPRDRPSIRYLGEWLIEQQRCDEAIPLLEHVIKIENLMPEPATEQIAEIKGLLVEC